MKPLVYYARWQGAQLRLRGRSETAVWGQLVYPENEGEDTLKTFHFDLKQWHITIEDAFGSKTLALDEMGTLKKEES
ncbi:MAG: hypothetical protein GY943_13980 [Chloroflexi bacterium]|nr:hypothetical protein [Chloroflexota bacterium]